MKNKLTDLSNHLYSQLERLSDESISKEDLDLEIKRAEAITKVAGNIIGIAQTTVNAAKLISQGNIKKEDMLGLLS